MNMQPAVHSRTSANGFGRRKIEREVGTRSQTGKSNSGSRLATTGSKIGGHGSPSHDRFVYILAGLLGRHVDVHLKNGSIYSGIFHAANTEKDFGIILKMAYLTKDGGSRGQKSTTESVSKAPSKMLIIYSKELVQVLAKDVSVTKDGFFDEVQSEKQQELMIDSIISQSHHVESERVLKPWVPDEDDPQCPELENIFDGHWNRGWDQFRANETLFGVKSTFDEELYTTKLERGPKMRELEKQAQRIAREIEGEETHDLHSAEERGLQLGGNLDIDEETRFSSVYRGKIIDDSCYEENEDTVVDSHNNETFGDSSTSASNSSAEWNKGKSNDVVRGSSSSCAVDQAQSSQSNVGVDLGRSDSYDHARQLASESPFKSSSSTASENRILENQLSEHGGNANEFSEKQDFIEETQLSKSDDSLSSLTEKKDDSDKGLSPSATSDDPSRVPQKANEKNSSPSELVEGPGAGKAYGQKQVVNSHGRPGSSTSSTSDCAAVVSATSGPGLSPSSSVGSLSSEKSTLNPHAKEFKLNPNAKSFVPSQTPIRPPSPVSDGPYYFPPNMSAVPQMSGMPVSIGIAPSFPHQQVMFNHQAGQLQAPQTYFHPNAPQYGQQMLLGHPRQVLYMPSFQPEMPYKGREY